ncbi:MAG: formylmethanofuran--tetrahydromethanopterin N-formyltransferase [Gemmatimonadetes bacterium]|nr:formylmethanofuran--tetrahydromethanopterin N-formyltransferase [Gemmatimonadota bacterium]
MSGLSVNGVEIEDTYAEAFKMRAARVVVTAETGAWAHTAARVTTGYATSVIGCDAEAGIEAELTPDETPDGRPGVSLLFFGFTKEALCKALVNRLGQCVMTCPTTACFNGLPIADEKVKVGGQLRFFGDGYQSSKRLNGRRYWRVPVMDGEFVCEETFAVQRAVAGGNFLLLGTDQASTLAAAETAIEAIRQMRGVILPFPGGIVRSGSKVGSRYKALRASTNDAYCPTLKALTRTDLPEGVNAVYELVIDGLDLPAVEAATRVGVRAACRAGVVRISAGNYGGKLGQYKIHLHQILADGGS